MRIAVVGAGSWGTALAQVMATTGHDVALWARDPGFAAELARTRCNPRYLPDLRLDERVAVTASLDAAVAGAEIAVFAVPTVGMRAVAERASAALPQGCVAVSAAKGFELGTERTMTAVLAEVLRDGTPVAVVSGPNIAAEIARGLPAATVVASADAAVSTVVRDACNSPRLRFYSTPDVVGVEYGGALKNVVAIAAGIADGMGAGDNGKAAIITRGIAEMTRLGVRAGASPLTFAGLAGIGDCIVTCTSPLSRNRRLGEAVGGGVTLEDALRGSHMVAEGVNAARIAQRLARRLGEDVPIVDAVCAVLFEGVAVLDAVAELMRRESRDEIANLRVRS